jgi:hypothetical protein
VLQLATPTFLISIFVGAWAFWILRKPEVKAAFIDNLKRSVRSRPEAPPTAPPGQLAQASLDAARARVQGPSRWLLVTGIVYSTLTTGAAFVVFLDTLYVHPPNPDNADFWMKGLFIVLPLLAQGPIMIMGALKMRHLESYGWAVAGSILALLPTSPLAVVGLPGGIWALAVLTSPDVRAAFVENVARASPTDSRLT